MTKLEQYIKEHSWKYRMDNSKGLDSWDNYSSDSFDEAEWVIVISQSRDSDILSTSNFASALDQLGGESKHVKVIRFGHWGCGWIESIMVNPKSKKHIKIAFDISEALKCYPVLDESDFSERESEYRSDYANEAKNSLAGALSYHFEIKSSKKLIQIAYDLNMACQSYYGNDSCVNIYIGRSPDKRDIDQLKTCMEQIEFDYKNSRTFKLLYSKLA